MPTDQIHSPSWPAGPIGGLSGRDGSPGRCGSDLHVDNKKLWPPVIDLLTVAKGYATALGAALGDDLDSPVEPAAPMHWGGAPVDPTDPALPEGVQPLSGFITAAPDAMMRRLKQIGVVARADGARLVHDLKPGQRLVSREGDLWRWDGYAVAAHAPTGDHRGPDVAPGDPVPTGRMGPRRGGATPQT